MRKGGVMEKFKIAIVGATGLVGQKILQVLYEEGLYEKAVVTLFVSKRSSGKVCYFKGDTLRLVELDEMQANKKFDFVFFSAGEEISKKYAKIFADAGAFVIDNTNAFRKDKPLVIPEINFESVADEKIISNPNCSTIELAMVISKLLKICEIEKIVVSTYQSVSGAGKDAVADLKNGTNNYFEKGIKNNIIAKIGELDENGNSTEENKIMFELNKILKTQIKVIATAVRVPVEYCHGESVYVEFKKEVDFEKIKKSLANKNLELLSDVCLNNEVADTNKTIVCRLRKVGENEIVFFVMADNLRRGAAYNAVMIAQNIIKNLSKN